jgi:periplasmic protein CpxP/Spy
MKSITKRLLIATAAAGVLGTTAAAWAFGGSHGQCNGMDAGRSRTEHMQQGMAAHQTELKNALKLTAQQEAAWVQYQQAMTPPKASAAMDHAEMAKLTTPQRLEKMQALHQERQAQMNQHLQATKTFYASLTPEQQKVFDQQHNRQGRHGKHHDDDKRGHMGHHG